jgi:hypothetical protein
VPSRSSKFGRDSLERKPILDAVRVPVERLLGIKVVFVVERMTMFGDWAFAALHPRTEVGDRIDYRRTLIAETSTPNKIVTLSTRWCGGAAHPGPLVEHAFLPTDVVWEEWQEKYKLLRAVPQRIAGGRDPPRAPIPCVR